MMRAKVLIINNDPGKGPEIEDRLTAAGHDVRSIAFPECNPLEKVAELNPDLVLMDMTIRGKIDGVQAADMIQSRLDIPVIYIMPNHGTGQATLQRSKATGPFGYLFEPLDAKQIAGTIEVALLRNQLEREIKESRQWLSTVLNSIGDGVIAVDDQRAITFINPVAEVLTGWQAAEAVGRPLFQVFSVPDLKSRETIASTLSRAMTGATRDFAGTSNATLRSRDGDECPVEMTVSRLKKGQDMVKGMVLVFRDITERRRAIQEIRQQASRAEALLEVASRLNKQIELDALLETVCVTTNRTLKATGTAVFLLDSKTGMLRNKAAFSEVVLLRALDGSKFEFRREILDTVITRDHPVAIIRDPHDSKELPYVNLLSRLRIGTLVIAALFLHDELMGALISVFADMKAVITEDDMALLAGLADQASSAIANAELFEQVRAGRERQRVLAKSLVEVQEAERRHVARELHDQLGQSLTGLQFMLEGVKSHAEEAHKGNLEEIQQYVSDIMEQTREISLRLRPGMLDDLGLLPTLLWHFDRYTRQTGIQVDFHESSRGPRYPTEIETTTYRIIQETLTNVARYAQVKQVLVELSEQADTLLLEVCDHGAGFDPSLAFNKPTSGLSGMRERASLVGGYLTVNSHPGQGTRIVVMLPLKGQTLERRKYDRDHPTGR